MQQLASFTQGVHEQVNPGGDRPNRVRACWSCNKQDHIAAACPPVPRKLQDKRSRKGIPFSKAVSLSDRQVKGSFPGFFVKCLSAPLIIGCDFQSLYTKAILPQDEEIEWTTGAVSVILGYHLGVWGRQYKALEKPWVRPNDLALASATVFRSGTQNEAQVVTRSTMTG